MRQTHAEEIYTYFNSFVTEFLIKGNSIITSDTDILNDQAISSCFANYIEEYKEGGESFSDKVKEQFKNSDLKTKLVFAHAEWLWSFAVDDISVWRKKEQIKQTTGITDDAKFKNVFPDGFGSSGMYHKNNKYHEIKFNLQLIRLLHQFIQQNKIAEPDEVKNWIEKACLYKKYNQEFEGYKLPDDFKNNLPTKTIAVCNILCHVAFPEKYERIASDNHKWEILDSFSGLLSEAEKNNDQFNTDEKILLIRKALSELTKPDFDFYEEQYAQVWNYSLKDEGFSEVQGLQYKKSIILYGPPGTSKTHSAKRLAKALITNSYLKKSKENVVKYFKKEEDFTSKRIHHLQLHSNYTYEDFVAGIQLKDHSTVPIRGKLFDICEAAEKDKDSSQVRDMPHILILDEINRIDLSRLFGEVFSALENRDEPIDLSIGNLKLMIPRNLYVIGTMNEIDFSLERIDFALRRRFLWFFFGFNSDTLAHIFWEKDRILNTKLKEDEADRFFQNAESLNQAVSRFPELGEQYQIGHTFFGEIVNIYKTYIELNGYTKLSKQLYRTNGPAQILWEISIEPMLKAFLGNMDKQTRDEKIAELYGIYYK